MAGDAFALRNLPLVMREDVVRATRVDVEPIAEKGHRHGRAFDVPAWKARSPWAGPHLQAVLAGSLPEREIPRVPLARINLATRTRQELIRRVPRELAVGGEARDVVVHVSPDLVGVPAGDQLLDQVDHLRDVVSGVGVLVRAPDV